MVKNPKVAFDNVQGRPPMFSFFPEDVRLIGRAGYPLAGKYDTAATSKGEHPLFEASVTRAPNEARVQLMLDKGCGYLDPVLIRKDGRIPECLDGRGRIIDAREANVRRKDAGLPRMEITAVQFKGSDSDAVVAALASNIHRREMGFKERAEVARYLAQSGCTEDRIAIAFGLKSKKAAKDLLAYWDLAAPVQKSIEAGRLAHSTAVNKLAGLERADQVAQLVELEAAAQEAGVQRITGATVTRAQREKAGKDAVPPKRLLLKLEAHPTVFGDLKGAHPVDLLRWILGKNKATEVHGLSELLKEIRESA